MIGGVSLARCLQVLASLGIFGALLLPWQGEIRLTATREGYHSTPLGLDLREHVGQSGFLAALSGFRAPVAALLWIDAHGAWERTEWGRMAALFGTVTTLQPHTLLYWDIAAWHMAWNAGIAALQDKMQPSEFLRERSSRQYIRIGRDFLERGIRNNPDSWLLHERLGILLRDREGDHAAAADEFALASGIPGAPDHLRRFAAYESSKVPGREREAYARLRSLYEEGGRMKTPSVMLQLRSLERKLGIKEEDCIPGQGKK